MGLALWGRFTTHDVTRAGNNRLISIQTVLLVGLGFLIASFVVVCLTPAYRARTVRLTTERVRASMPTTEQELKADKVRIRAEHAMRVHRLEQQLDQSKFGAARQLVEVSRRDGSINTLTGQIEVLKTDFDAALNARNVLEQTIADRLPKVEQRLIEAKKLLFQRDRDIQALGDDAARTQRALVEAVQINAQQRAEIDRLTMVLETRGAQNRDGLSDPTFDAELAMRSEIEALRARGRDQASLIERLKDGALKSEVGGASNAGEAAAMLPEIVRMQRDLAASDVGAKVSVGHTTASREQQHVFETELRQRNQRLEDQGLEIAKLSAALASFQKENASDERGGSIKDSRIAMKSRLSALQVQTEGQAETIRKLRSEVASSNERLARQAQHFMEEMRRLGAGTLPASGSARRVPTAAERQSLTQRISEAKPDLALGLNGASRPILVKSDAAVVTVDVAAPTGAANVADVSGAEVVAEPTPAVAAPDPIQPPAADAAGVRPVGSRPRLLDRITDYGKG